MGVDTTNTIVGASKRRSSHYVYQSISYFVFISWTLLTVLPLIWMGYSSFKTNSELTRDIFALPSMLMFDGDHVYRVVDERHPDRSFEGDYLAIESTTIRRYRHFLDADSLTPELLALDVGDRLIVNDLPPSVRRGVLWRTFIYNYSSAWERGSLGEKFMNSVIYVTVSTSLQLLFALMASYAFAKMGFTFVSRHLSRIIAFGYLLSIPSLMIPLFIMLSNLGLTNNHYGIILVYIAFGLPLAVMLCQGFIRGIPDSIIESAQMDGASHWRIFLAIIVPMTTPVIITIAIVGGLGIWNEFLLVLVVGGRATQSLPVGVFSFASQTSVELGWQMAALVISVLPAVIVYFSFNKRITRGVVAGAVKG
ncbi:carbohydrate ABC transporter permease [Spirochaeta dissipatitropha]